MDLIAPTDRGLYCAAGDFHIDPWRPVARAVITHAHSDHARFGSDVYVCHRDTAPILRKRIAVTQVIDARNRAPEVPDPIAVCDDEYCWIFRQANNRLSQLVVVRSVRRLQP